jgi:hypothetical protein
MPRKTPRLLGHKRNLIGQNPPKQSVLPARGLADRGELSDLALEQIAGGLLKPSHPIPPFPR